MLKKLGSIHMEDQSHNLPSSFDYALACWLAGLFPSAFVLMQIILGQSFMLFSFLPFNPNRFVWRVFKSHRHSECEYDWTLSCKVAFQGIQHSTPFKLLEEGRGESNFVNVNVNENKTDKQLHLSHT